MSCKEINFWADLSWEGGVNCVMPEKDVVLLTGDGIGPEITAAVLDVLDAAGAKINWIEASIGLAR